MSHCHGPSLQRGIIQKARMDARREVRSVHSSCEPSIWTTFNDDYERELYASAYRSEARYIVEELKEKEAARRRQAERESRESSSPVAVLVGVFIFGALVYYGFKLLNKLLLSM